MTKPKVDRHFQDCPLAIEKSALSAARKLLGSGYVDDYYASAASEFMFLYRAGYREACHDMRKKVGKVGRARL